MIAANVTSSELTQQELADLYWRARWAAELELWPFYALCGLVAAIYFGMLAWKEYRDRVPGRRREWWE